MPDTVHGTAIDVGGRAALIRGLSGSGKSDLALRCLTTPFGFGMECALVARLVADDRVVVERRGDAIEVVSPSTIAGRIEVRGVGIIDVAHAARSRLALLVDLVPPERIERMPEPAYDVVLGVRLPLLRLAPFEASAPAKLMLALTRA